jgi:N12 class adenine-specific DNA methylase
VNCCLPKRNTSQSRTPKASPVGPSNSATKPNTPLPTPLPTARFTAAVLVEHALNNRTPTACDEITGSDGQPKLVVNQNETLAARERQQELKDNFQKWIWQEADRSQRLARQYNDQFNHLRLRTYDGSHLTFPGMCRHSLRNGELAPHQKNAAWRILQSNSTLIGHVVGAGKTFTLVAAAMELKRLGNHSEDDVRRSQSPGRSMGHGISQTLSARQSLRRR